jgi:regulator of cell morphogenesis and NO signaling
MLYTSIIPGHIDEKDLVSDIVVNDYRAADIFRKYGINFCCGGKIPLETACQAMGLDPLVVLRDLEQATQERSISHSLSYDEWSLPFLTDYIIHVHHAYLKKALPEIKDYLWRFAEGHTTKFPYLPSLQSDFMHLYTEMIPHMREEEEVMFPYIRQIANAYEKNEPYAALLVRTLRKPVENMMLHEHEMVGKILKKFRQVTGNYIFPENSCVNHKVTFSKLKELDSDLVQHMHLENNILFPKAIEMEKELLKR